MLDGFTRMGERGGMGVLEKDVLGERLERYLQRYQGAFRRRDQARWAAVYLQGLLRAEGRKNIENLARAVTLPEGLRAEDVAQALQHFIHQSPWDEGRLWRRFQEESALSRTGRGGVFVLEETAFIKQGRHSVGVQRQYSRVLGRKTNCQLAVALHHVGPGGCTPLALRLYLPRAWLRDEDRLRATGVPEASRREAGKRELGLELIDAVREAGVEAVGLCAGSGWETSEEMQAGATARGLKWQPAVPLEWVADLEAGRRRLAELGLEHFEGRSWRGFHHHACLVMLACGFLAVESEATRPTAERASRDH